MQKKWNMSQELMSWRVVINSVFSVEIELMSKPICKEFYDFWNNVVIVNDNIKLITAKLPSSIVCIAGTTNPRA